ncbi:MAG: sugar-binding protein [Verrucomicrobiales bacterium]|nr:sugar-binding protein [bacterium]MDF2378206.1 sugar-binding protein [Verrucomicrobiales bacterium]
MTRRYITLPLLAALVIGVAGCQDSEPGVKRFAFISNGVAEFWKIAEAGANQAGEDFGIEVNVLMPGSLSDQKQMMEDSITRGMDGVAVSPIDSSNQTDMLNEVAAATLLVTHDSDAPDSDRLAYIGMDNYTAGRLCGDLVKEALPDGGEVMIFIGRMEQDNSRKRRQGVIDAILDRSVDPERFDPPGEVIKGEKYTILGTLTDGFDLSQAKANAEDTISKFPDIDAMVGLFVYNPPAILQALEQSGKIGEVQVIGFDEQDETLAGIQAGTVYGTVVQDPYAYGYESMKLLNEIANGNRSGLENGPVISIPGRQIRKDNVDAFWADLKAKVGE